MPPTPIDVKPLYLVDALLKIATANYEKHVSGVTFSPAVSSATWTGLTPSASFTRTGTPTWTCKLDYVQDWDTADSLSRFLFDHAGETVAVEFTPEGGATGETIVANITIVPGDIGGAGGAYATGSVTCGSDYPKFADSVAAADALEASEAQGS